MEYCNLYPPFHWHSTQYSYGTPHGHDSSSGRLTHIFTMPPGRALACEQPVIGVPSPASRDGKKGDNLINKSFYCSRFASCALDWFLWLDARRGSLYLYNDGVELGY
ncbi:hypothetical protein BaRGS_00015738 [Batillaria attramentaria]|uniref:Uncharacterized protein n=1 Tax=Batillaria attramentaria TaxID=370345 RepID=A0ABD0L1B5_9CAEN